MKTITLNVDDALANQYEAMPAIEKNRILRLIQEMFEETLKKERTVNLLKSMEALSKTARKNGLTPRKLQELMGWDEATFKNLFGEEEASAHAG